MTQRHGNVSGKRVTLLEILASDHFLLGVFDAQRGMVRFDDVEGNVVYEYGRLYAATGGPVPIAAETYTGRKALPRAFAHFMINIQDIAPGEDVGEISPLWTVENLAAQYLQENPELAGVG